MLERRLVGVLCALVLSAARPAAADYHSHPELKPDKRCQGIPAGIGSPTDSGDVASLHCQKLFWDLPVATALNTVAVSAPFAEDMIPRFPHGVADRIPPMFVGDVNGVPDGFERLVDCESKATGCHRLCESPYEVPYWAPVTNPDGTAVIGGDGFGKHDVADPTQPQTGPLVRVACRRGTRVSYGPWQTGGAVDQAACKAEPGSDTDAVIGACQSAVFDRLAATQVVLFDNTAHLDDDVANQRTTADRRLEWAVGSEIYNHFSSHHGTCYRPTDPCANASQPKPRSAYDASNPQAQCYQYERGGQPDSDCYSADVDPRCGDDHPAMGGPRNATQLPGRLSLPLPAGRGFLDTEDPIWGCNHHVVTQLPPGSYGMDRLANYRLQVHGLVNDTGETIWGVEPNHEFGGAVGEMVLQNFSEPVNADIGSLNIMASAAQDLATTYYPPFTWHYHEQEWPPPYDAAIGLTSIHSHHRMVKGTMNVAPVNPPRPNGSANCGGPRADGLPSDLYTDWYWEDPPVCEYWREPDGPFVLRKGESLRTTCYVNNGITPEAIKHGLIAGATVQALKALGAPIPDYPKLVPASTWGDALVGSAVGQELLYGKHPPINYRVVYKCSTRAGDVPYASMVGVVENALNTYQICSPNTVVDADGDYVDGAYRNEIQCGGALCEPSSIVFACIGEDEMCFSVAMFWALPRLGNPETHDEAVENLEQGDLDHVGTPGSTPNSDLAGGCSDCELGL
ncbi:MAG: hypothetical protein ACREQQ_17215 [Candidatus Binatia bacterium]